MIPSVYTIDNVISTLPRGSTALLPPSIYTPQSVDSDDKWLRLGLAVESMKHHTTDEGFQIFSGLQSNGYTLVGYGFPPPYNLTHVPDILKQFNPSVVVVQDKREWDVVYGDFREEKARFTEVTELKKRKDIFKLTILKDAQQKPHYHRQSAQEIGCHAWIVYYHPRIVRRLAPYVRPQHIIRTYHTVDSDIVPEYKDEGRQGCILSGAISDAYPLRTKLVKGRNFLPQTTYMPHPGYHRDGCCTPDFLCKLSEYKVAICTASRYGYALRKIIEATAAGCVVITDLPFDERLPEIDDNLVRVHPRISLREMAKIIEECLDSYNPLHQYIFAEKAKTTYDYRTMSHYLVRDIEEMRTRYSTF